MDMFKEDLYKSFDIELNTLSFGRHEFDIKIGETFFEKYKNEEIRDCDINIHLKIEKQETMFLFSFHLSGYMIFNCDVCLDEIKYPIDCEEELILKISRFKQQSDDENIDYITASEHIYNVEQIVYELLYAQIPMKKVHGEITDQPCDPQMLDLLDKNTFQKTEEDPRWEMLKGIKENIDKNEKR